MSAPALTEVTVTVTAEHIAKGQRDACSDCPVALALADAFPEATWIWVGPAHASIEIDGGDLEIDLPADVEEFIHAFDHGRPVEPFAFTVEAES